MAIDYCSHVEVFSILFIFIFWFLSTRFVLCRGITSSQLRGHMVLEIVTESDAIKPQQLYYLSAPTFSVVQNIDQDFLVSIIYTKL